MPIYAYRCTNCGFEKDFLQKMSDKPLTKCPQCGKDALVKELSAPGFELQGHGLGRHRLQRRAQSPSGLSPQA